MLLPSRDLWTPPLGAGLGEPAEPPGHFRWPGPPQFTAGFVTGLHGLYEGDDSAVRTMDAPVRIATAGLVGAVESAAGKSLGNLIVGGIAPSLAENVYDLAAALVDGAIDLVIDTVSQSVADSIGGGMAIIPYLGQFVKNLFTAITAKADQRRLEAELDQCVQRKLNDYCRQVPNLYRIKSTIVGGPSPADVFRQHAYAYQFGDNELPANVASMYVLLCGAESEGFGFANKSTYDAWLSRHLPSGFGSYGIEPALQRKMWKLIKGIMAAVQNPALGERPTATDQGRTLMPLLQEIVRQQWLRGRIPRPYLEVLSDYIGGRFTRSCQGSLPGGAGVTQRHGSCVDDPRRLSFVPSLQTSLEAWETLIEEKFWDATAQKWKLSAAGFFLKMQGKRGMLALDTRAAAKIEKAIVESTDTRSPLEKLTPMQGLALGTGMLGMGYGAWTAVRRFGPRR